MARAGRSLTKSARALQDHQHDPIERSRGRTTAATTVRNAISEASVSSCLRPFRGSSAAAPVDMPIETYNSAALAKAREPGHGHGEWTRGYHPPSHPLLSIVVPAYNEVGRRDGEASNRGLDRSRRGLRIIFVNDGSRDHTLSACARRAGESTDSLHLLREEFRPPAGAHRRRRSRRRDAVITLMETSSIPEMIPELVGTGVTGTTSYTRCASPTADTRRRILVARILLDHAQADRVECRPEEPTSGFSTVVRRRVASVSRAVRVRSRPRPLLGFKRKPCRTKTERFRQHQLRLRAHVAFCSRRRVSLSPSFRCA
jgi:hypothetical protein